MEEMVRYEGSTRREYGLKLLRTMLGEDVNFRDGQWEAIETLAIKKKRALIVQRTGWGKSIVYFLSTKILRDNGAGVTLLISPLLSLMRNQIEMARRIGIRAYTMHSANQKEWDNVEKVLMNGECDILLISPERLSNTYFKEELLQKISGKVGMLVVDEAHCISDWGHDFRPDYRRIVRIIQHLPKGIPVLGTTATANNRVVNDIKAQLGEDLILLRGALVRTSLRLQNIRIDSQAERMAWLVENIPLFPGSGIVYCTTIRDAERVANWLKLNGIEAKAYHSKLQSEREELEQCLINNEVKALVATVALGMGFDKPDLGFVIHYQKPGSVVAYYQQVGRAGRAISRSYGILLAGKEDDEIQEYFIKSAFPPADIMLDILNALDKYEGLTITQLQKHVNARMKMIENALKILEVDGAVIKEKRIYSRTLKNWQPDLERMDQITNLRYTELAQMQAYIDHPGCLMEYLERALDDLHPEPCGRCANCQGKGLPNSVKSSQLLNNAKAYLNNYEIKLNSRKVFPKGVLDDIYIIPDELLNKPGRTLCFYGDEGLGKAVEEGKYQQNYFSDQLVKEAVILIKTRWSFYGEAPQWVTAIPSLRRPELVYDYGERLAKALYLPFIPVFIRTCNAPEQKSMQNSALQAKNVISSLALDEKKTPKNQVVLLVDDIWDSGWTMTYAGWLLMQNGSKAVYPFTLACTNG
jgi:ATP-dependent DNA helicase RecQ